MTRNRLGIVGWVAAMGSLLLLPAVSFAAITTANSGSGAQVTASTLTQSFTSNVTSDGILFVCVEGDTTDKVTGVTYSGVSTTLLTKYQYPSGRWAYLFYLVAPAAGTNNIIVTGSASTQMSEVSASYNGVAQTAPIDKYATSTTSGASTLDTTTTGNTTTDWAILCNANNNGSPTTHSGTNVLQALGSGSAIGDSNATITASQTLGYTFGGSAAAVNIMASFLAYSSGGSPVTEATSSTDQIQQDWLGAYMVFFSCMVFVVWLMRKRT